MKHLDKQMQKWSKYLHEELNITPTECNHLASSIALAIRELSKEAKNRVKKISPISIKCRYDELLAFQAWMDVSSMVSRYPVICRAQVITQNYICFVYLKDTCFSILAKELKDNTTAQKCCKYLISDRLRAFRNAFSHGNWRYLKDFSGLEFWAWDNPKNKKLIKDKVSQVELEFWQALARCTAYTSYLALMKKN